MHGFLITYYYSYEFKKVIKKDGQTDWTDQPELRFVNVVF